MEKLLILGTRTLAVEIADLASDVPGVEVAGFVENLDRERCREPLEGLPVYWVDELAPMKHTHRVIGGLATTYRSVFVEQAAAQEMAFATIVHPTARVSKTAQLDAGTVVGPGSIVSAHVKIGRHVFINRGVLIGHHTGIGDFCTLQPGANIAGCCRIEEQVYVGIGVVVIDNIAIGAHSFIGAGSLVIKDVASRVQVFGVPARVIRENFDGK